MKLVGTGDDMGIQGTDEIVEHCKRKLANLLSAIPCSESPRDLRDWLTACRIIEGDDEIFKGAVFDLIKDHFENSSSPSEVPDDGIDVLCDYARFDRVCGPGIEEQFQELRRKLPCPPYTKVL